MYTLSLDLPNQAEGAEVEVDGLGLFLNGTDNDVSEADARQFAVKHGYSLLKANFQEGIVVVHGAAVVEEEEDDDPPKPVKQTATKVKKEGDK